MTRTAVSQLLRARAASPSSTSDQSSQSTDAQHKRRGEHTERYSTASRACQTISTGGVEVHLHVDEHGTVVVQVDTLGDARHTVPVVRVNVDGLRVHGDAPPRFAGRDHPFEVMP